MKNTILAATILATAISSAAVPGAYTPRDYVQDGLVAQWDGQDYCAYGVHPLSWRYWIDLIGRRSVHFKNIRTYTADGTYCAANENQWAKSYGGDFGCFGPSSDGLTVEIAVTFSSVSGTQPILTAPEGTGIAVSLQSGNLVLASSEKGETPVLACGLSAGAMLRLSIGYRDGEVVDGNVFLDGVSVSREASVTATGSVCDGALYLFRAASGGKYANLTFHSLRVYDRLLTAEEAAANAKLDDLRFSKALCFEVVSGSLTADGETYAAGDKVYSARGAAAEITAAESAVIRPAADGSSRISVTGCTVSLEPVDAAGMTFIESLVLGADAVLALPATGLGLNAAALTADATASVRGAGLLVSASESCPVSLTDGATYRAAGGAFDGWPASGAAYVPVGSAPAIATAGDAAAVEALDAIVFLDDGTEAADATTVTVSAAEMLTLSAKIAGPGVIAASQGGGVLITGNNDGFLGNFDFSGVDVVVSNEYGLGSSVSRAAKIVRSETSKLVFDNASNVFTNYAKLWINNADVNSRRAIGSVSSEKKLVLAETLAFGHPAGSGTQGNHRDVYIDYNVDLLKGYRTEETDPLIQPYLAAQNDGECRIYGEIHQASSGYGWISRANTFFYQGTYNIGRVNQRAAMITCCAPDVFHGSDISPPQSSYGNTLDLNGYDQHVRALNVYNNKSAAESGDPTHVIDSAAPAKLIVTSLAYTSRPKFTGSAGFEYAASVAATNVLAGVESTSDGELSVTAGTLALRNGFAWTGKKVTVSGGRLILDSAHALAGGKAAVSIVGDGVLELTGNAGCTINKLTFGTTVIDTPGDYTLAALKSEGCPIEGPDAAVVTIVRSYDGEWQGWPTTPGATALVPENTTVSISDEDVAAVAALAAIEIGPNSSVICTNATQRLVLPGVQGFGSFLIVNSAGVEIAGDSSGLMAPGGFVISNSCVTVTGKNGLGSAQTAAALVYCGTKDDVLTFTGAGLTNNVQLKVWKGTGKNGGLVLGSPAADEIFVQNAGICLMTGNYYYLRNAVRFTGGSITYEIGKTSAMHLYAEFLNEAPRKEAWFEEGCTIDAGNRRWFTSNGKWHISCSWSSGQIHPASSDIYICERADALAGRTFAPYSGALLDLNGYDQNGLIWAPEFDGSRIGSVVTSAVPAKITITACSYSSAYDTYAVSYTGEAGLEYAVASTEKSSTLTNRFSDTVAPLVVSSGKLVFAKGAGWGGTNVTIRSGATLRVDAAAAPTAFKPSGKTASRADLVIESGGTLELAGSDDVVCRSLVYGGETVKPGRYTAASSVGVTGEGTLVVRKFPGRQGMCLIIK